MTPSQEQIDRWAKPERWAKIFAQIKSVKTKGCKCQVSPLCWEWQGRVNDAGYAELSFNLDGKRYTVLLHRLLYVQRWGSIAEDIQIRHAMCGNRRCCNPYHLFSGTPKDNAGDPVSYRGKRRIGGIPYKDFHGHGSKGKAKRLSKFMKRFK